MENGLYSICRKSLSSRPFCSGRSESGHYKRGVGDSNLFEVTNARSHKSTRKNWCRRRDSNPHTLSSATPSRWCVCQVPPLRHSKEFPPNPPRLQVPRVARRWAARYPVLQRRVAPRELWTGRSEALPELPPVKGSLPGPFRWSPW